MESILAAAELAWALIAFIVGWVILAVIIGFATNFAFVAVTNKLNNPDNEE